VNLTAEAVIHWCSLRLENFMVPKFVDFQGEFPKTSTGKISKRELALAGASALPVTSQR
jgi:acyl-CoA synthetase (AMP-forming)/AMP-acid ligase II